MERVIHNGRTVALKISAIADGTSPVSAPEDALQLLTLKHPQGKVVAPHRHLPKRRQTAVLQECLVVITGRLRVTFYGEDTGTVIAHVEIGPGETCITLEGPHGIEFLEDSEVFELKNGPFVEDKEPFDAKVS